MAIGERTHDESFLELPPNRAIAGIKLDDEIRETEQRIDALVQELELARGGLIRLQRQKEEFYKGH